MSVMFAALTLPAPASPDARSRTGKPAPMDEARFELLYRRMAGSLWSYLFRLTGDAAVADDLLQKSFFRYLRANPSLATEERSEEHTSELQSQSNLVCRLLLEKKKSR